MSDYLSHIVEQSRGVTPSVHPLIAPMFAPPSFSAFISLEDLVQQQTPDSALEETPEALLTPSLALPDILAAQSSRVSIEPVEPQLHRVEEILSPPRLKAESHSEQPAIQPLQEEMIDNDKAPVGADLSCAPPIYRPTDREAASFVDHSDQPTDREAATFADHDDRPTLSDAATFVDLHKVSDEPPEPLSPLAPERDAPKNLDLMRFDETSVGTEGSRPSPVMDVHTLSGPSHPVNEPAVETLSPGQGTEGSRPSPVMDVHTLSGISHAGAVGADLSRPSPIYRPKRNLTTYPDYVVNPHYRPTGSASGLVPSAVQGERDELLSPRDPRRPSPAYQHDGNLAPEPDAQQRPLTRPRVDDTHRSESVIRVSIGRVEVHATAPPAAPVIKRAAPAAPALSLSDYLKRRKGGTR